jgi:hypothetical protein
LPAYLGAGQPPEVEVRYVGTSVTTAESAGGQGGVGAANGGVVDGTVDEVDG